MRCYAISGTEIGYASTRCPGQDERAARGTVTYAATRRPVLPSHIRLARRVTDPVPHCYSVSSYRSCLSAYSSAVVAMCGTDVAYGARRNTCIADCIRTSSSPIAAQVPCLVPTLRIQMWYC
eukprot:3941941-Rhodomonas_salina.3